MARIARLAYIIKAIWCHQKKKKKFNHLVQFLKLILTSLIFLFQFVSSFRKSDEQSTSSLSHMGQQAVHEPLSSKPQRPVATPASSPFMVPPPVPPPGAFMAPPPPVPAPSRPYSQQPNAAQPAEVYTPDDSSGEPKRKRKSRWEWISMYRFDIV